MCELATWQAPVKFSFLDVHLVKGLNEDVAHLACFCVGVRWCAVTPQSSSAFFDGILFGIRIKQSHKLCLRACI